MSESRRRRLEIALGLLWLLDGALQFQPVMFTRDLFAGILGMANMGLPGPLSSADYRVSLMLVAHPALWNTVFATLQVALGAGLLWGRGRAVRLARPASIVWALGVWIVGEGVGGMFMGGTSILTGAPGAAVLYAVLAVVTWPVDPDSRLSRLPASAATAGWVAAIAGSALLELQQVNHAATVPGAQVYNGSFGEPLALAWLNRAAGHAIGGGGLLFASVVGAVAFATGVGVLSERTRRPALVAGVAIAVFVGIFGQDLGGVATGHGTDPGTAPLLILLAFSLWREPLARPAVAMPRRRPRSLRIRPAPHPAATG